MKIIKQEIKIYRGTGEGLREKRVILAPINKNGVNYEPVQYDEKTGTATFKAVKQVLKGQ